MVAVLQVAPQEPARKDIVSPVAGLKTLAGFQFVEDYSTTSHATIHQSRRKVKRLDMEISPYDLGSCSRP